MNSYTIRLSAQVHNSVCYNIIVSGHVRSYRYYYYYMHNKHVCQSLGGGSGLVGEVPKTGGGGGGAYYDHNLIILEWRTHGEIQM